MRFRIIPFDPGGYGRSYTTPPEWRLFDLEKNPCEMNNVYNDPAYTDMVKELKGELLRLKKRWMTRTGAIQNWWSGTRNAGK